jgi:hypothetical protein
VIFVVELNRNEMEVSEIANLRFALSGHLMSSSEARTNLVGTYAELIELNRNEMEDKSGR